MANRFVRSATHEGLALPDGKCSNGLIRLSEGLAEGKLGLIITGHAFVGPEGAVPRQLGIDRDELVPSLNQLTDAVHRVGGNIVIQLSHAGRYSNPRPGLNDKNIGGRPAGFSPDIMSRQDIDRVIQDFSRAAERAYKAGFDGVQLHAAHGYLLSEFLSPYFNKRPDEFGGTVEGRAHLLLNCVKSIRGAVPDLFPVLVKINSQDYIDGGFRINDMLETSVLLEKVGVDAIEVSGGTTAPEGLLSPVRSFNDTQDSGPYYTDAAAALKKRIALPVILGGGVRSLNDASKIVESNAADYVAMSRPLICEPGLIKRWKKGDVRPSQCLSDNFCLGSLAKKLPFGCWNLKGR